jgi:hypothetical protein
VGWLPATTGLSGAVARAARATARAKVWRTGYATPVAET